MSHRIYVRRVTVMAKKKAVSKAAGRNSAKSSETEKTASARSAGGQSPRTVAKKKSVATKKVAAMKKAITTDVVSINPTSCPSQKDLENAVLGATKSMGQFRSELGWD